MSFIPNITQESFLDAQNIIRPTIVQVACEFLGFPASNYEGYLRGQSPDQGFDCSGFVLYVIRQAQNKIPSLIVSDGIRHANEMFDRLGVLIHDEERLPGDLIFFSRKGLLPSHVGIYLGQTEENKEYFIHSPGRNDTRIRINQFNDSPLPLLHEKQIYRKNPIGFKRLTMQNGENGRYNQII